MEKKQSLVNLERTFMTKNKLLVALMFPLILIPLIWSATTKSVNAEASVEKIQESNVENVEVDDESPELKKAPAPALDSSDIPKTPIKKPGLENELQTETELQTERATVKTHTYPSQNASTEGATASCSAISWRTTSLPADNAAQISCSIKDTRDDGNSVYVKWWLDGYGDIHLTNSKGYNTITYEKDARQTPTGDGIGHVYWAVCRDIRFWRDNCSKTRSWKIN